MDIRPYIVRQNMKIMDAVAVIDQNGKKIAFAVDDDDKLLGTVTDGDLRRYILRNGDLSGTVDSLINYKPRFFYEDKVVDYEKFMLEHEITAIPILSRDKKLVRIEFLYKDKYKKYSDILEEVPVIIMAGGKGTRLKPYTNILPKPLIPMGNVTITERIIENFKAYGCKDFYMIVNYKKNLIKAYFDEIEDKPVFVNENTFLGTAGGLNLVRDYIKDTFILTNCDILLEADLKKIYNYHRENNNKLTVICAKKVETLPYGSINTDENGTVTGIEEKPSVTYNVNTGIYVIEPEVLDYIKEDTFIHITDIINILVEDCMKVGCYTVDENAWLDMGQFDELVNMKNSLDIL